METIRIPEKMKIMSGSVLKWIAVITMLIDHSAKAILYLGYLKPRIPLQRGTSEYMLYQFYKVLRGIGRTAFPIYCFLLVQGFMYTRDRRKYAGRLFIFALISEIPFNLGLQGRLWYPAHQNVYFTLFLGIIMLWLWEVIGEKIPDFRIALVMQAAEAAALMYLANYFHTDYRHKGLILILVFYVLRFFQPLACAGGAVAMYWEWPYVLIAFPFLLLYNGKRGKQNKYFFYVFYPAHLILIYIGMQLMKYFLPAG